MHLKGAFLREDEKSWVSSTLFFMSLNRLDLSDTIYHIPPGVVISNEDLTYYVDHLLDQLRASSRMTPEEHEAYTYCLSVAQVLRSWAKGGFSAKVV